MTAPVTDQPVRLDYVDQAGVPCAVRAVDAADERFELARPARGFPSWPRKRSYSGLWWCATTGSHVGYESWLERDHLMLLDHDPDVAGISSQPFRMTWLFGGRQNCHTPDFFARLGGGSGVVIDVRPAARVDEQARRAFDATSAMCATVGWSYRLLSDLDAPLLSNLRWLSGYRHPRYGSDLAVTARLLDVFETPLTAGAGIAGLGQPMRRLPTLFHLLWHRRLRCDMTAPLSVNTVVATTRLAASPVLAGVSA